MRFSPVGVIVLSVRIDTGGTEMHLGINNLRNGVIVLFVQIDTVAHENLNRINNLRI